MPTSVTNNALFTAAFAAMVAAGFLFAQTDSAILVNAAWKTKTIVPGLVWKEFHFPSLYSSCQSVNLLTIDAGRPSISPAFAYVASGFKKTSEFGASTGAIAAINGSFFNTTTGGAVTFLKVNGTVIKETDSLFFATRPGNDEAAFVIRKSRNAGIEKRPASGRWADLPDAAMKPDVMAGGPLLIFNGALFPQENIAFNTTRHPRTAIGIVDSTHLILITVDGRTDSAAGMTTAELARTLKYLGCASGLNIDGGGSTTMWVSGEPYSGVVSYPCDNGVYDHAGERSCCNSICIMNNPVSVSFLLLQEKSLLIPEARRVRVLNSSVSFPGRSSLCDLRGRKIGAETGTQAQKSSASGIFIQ